MSSKLPTRLRTPLLTAALLLAATGCGEGELEVGEATTVATDGTATPAAPAGTTPAVTPAAVDPALNPEPSTIGAVSLHLPLGWAPVDGAAMAVPGEGAAIQGGNKVTSVPAQGRTAAEWTQDLAAGTTDIFVEPEGMELQAPITTASGLEVFHLVQAYADNKAQLFGTVVDDTLHLVRFGLDGTEESAAVTAKSAATMSIA